jgi:hypothetical protein
MRVQSVFAGHPLICAFFRLTTDGIQFANIVLFRTHIDHVERSKYLMGSDKFEMMQSLPHGHNKGMAASVDVTNIRGISDIISAVHMSQSM